MLLFIVLISYMRQQDSALLEDVLYFYISTETVCWESKGIAASRNVSCRISFSDQTWDVLAAAYETSGSQYPLLTRHLYNHVITVMEHLVGCVVICSLCAAPVASESVCGQAIMNQWSRISPLPWKKVHKRLINYTMSSKANNLSYWLNQCHEGCVKWLTSNSPKWDVSRRTRDRAGEVYLRETLDVSELGQTLHFTSKELRYNWYSIRCF